MKLNFIDVSDVKDDLEHFNGYLPQPLLSYIDKEKYYNNIRKLQSRKQIYDKLLKAQRFSFEENIKDFKRWLKEHPEFKSIIRVKTDRN